MKLILASLISLPLICMFDHSQTTPRLIPTPRIMGHQDPDEALPPYNLPTVRSGEELSLLAEDARTPKICVCVFCNQEITTTDKVLTNCNHTAHAACITKAMYKSPSIQRLQCPDCQKEINGETKRIAQITLNPQSDQPKGVKRGNSWPLAKPSTRIRDAIYNTCEICKQQISDTRNFITTSCGHDYHATCLTEEEKKINVCQTLTCHMPSCNRTINRGELMIAQNLSRQENSRRETKKRKEKIAAERLDLIEIESKKTKTYERAWCTGALCCSKGRK